MAIADRRQQEAICNLARSLAATDKAAAAETKVIVPEKTTGS